jgi:hypothetical protein
MQPSSSRAQTMQPGVLFALAKMEHAIFMRHLLKADLSVAQSALRGARKWRSDGDGLKQPNTPPLWKPHSSKRKRERSASPCCMPMVGAS